MLCPAGVAGRKSDGGTCSCQGNYFYRLPDGAILVGNRYQEVLWDSAAEFIRDNAGEYELTIGVPDEVEDAMRSVLAPFLGHALPSQAEAKENTRRMWERIDSQVKARQEAERGIIPSITEEPSEISDPVNPDNCRRQGPNGQQPIRVKSRGLTCLVEENFERKVEQHGGKVLGCADAKGAGYVGSLAGPIQELVFEFEGKRWYCYRLTSDGGDTWCEECWTTEHRLTASAAADTLLAARKV